MGGGLAGLSLGIGLRREGIPVTISEGGHYPRHRVCGEFISGRGQEALTRLDLGEAFLHAGAVLARTAAFFLGQRSSPIRLLPSPALCLSRFAMDALLAERFRRAGGELRENERWREEVWGEGVVRATGRRLQTKGNGWRWLGVKVHAREVPLAADLEMHGSRDGYVGICRLRDGEVNVCGLLRRSCKAPEHALSWRQFLKGAPCTALRTRMAEAIFDETSFCSVAGFSLQPQEAALHEECAIGDALTMTPPVTGNGMSMAFEAAELAVEPLTAYSRGDIPWITARQAIANTCDGTFARRLASARWLQWMMLTPLFRTACGAAVLRSDWLWRTMFARTR
jgi:flavin-dependent dehydrogenase